MPDYFTLTSFEVGPLTPDERAWVDQVLARGEHDDFGVPVALAEIIADGDPCQVGFDFTVEQRPQGPVLAIFADESTGGELCNIALFLQAFLARFRPGETLGFEYARSCSRPVADSFGGGVVVVTTDGYTILDSSEVLDEKLRLARAG